MIETHLSEILPFIEEGKKLHFRDRQLLETDNLVHDVRTDVEVLDIGGKTSSDGRYRLFQSSFFSPFLSFSLSLFLSFSVSLFLSFSLSPFWAADPKGTMSYRTEGVGGWRPGRRGLEPGEDL